ncbi:MAG TPA: hypothetical protein V6C99_01135, partial [Oculatellaceae cyanobacterium]
SVTHAQPGVRLDLSWLPETPLYGDGTEGQDGIGWQLAPAPFALSEKQISDLQRLGKILQRFVQAVDTLYQQSLNPNLPVPAWVAELYAQGKPEALLQFAQMKRLKSHLPLVLRPDLLLNENGWTLCEIDAVPGGIGFTSALNRLYRNSGFSVLEAENGMPGAFLEMLKAFVQAKTPEKENPVIVIVLSDEAADYRAEMQWLVDTLRKGADKIPAYPHIALVHPKELDLVRDRLVFTDPDTGLETPIDLIYRFFELFDLPNIPKIELIQYAVKKGLVQCTPPFKPHVEEKLSLALMHHPALASFWEKELGQADFEQLKQWVPQGWVVDPTPVPPQAVIAGLTPGGRVIQDFQALKSLSQKERELVLKPSGFSPLGWGSRGVTIGHDHSSEEWGKRLDEALASFGKTPYILQKFVPAGVQVVERLNLETSETTPFKARTRLCPYYFVKNGEVTLAGVLATACPQDKKLIHGMKDAVLAPVGQA